jgi:hypothetical protein
MITRCSGDALWVIAKLMIAPSFLIMLAKRVLKIEWWLRFLVHRSIMFK